MAFITMSQFATEPRVTTGSPDFVDIRFDTDHRVGLTLDEAVTIANALLAAVEAAKSQRVSA